MQALSRSMSTIEWGDEDWKTEFHSTYIPVLHPFAKKIHTKLANRFTTPNWQTDLLHQIGKPFANFFFA
jgi:hypothetical protein